MARAPGTGSRAILIWGAVGGVVALPMLAAANSPLLQWRDPIYIAAGFAGIVAFALMLLQPLLVAGLLPGLKGPRGRRVHLWTGLALVVSVVLHVGGLWITSPPDVIDALLLVSPTPFSDWGVAAMWALFAAAGLAALRHRLTIRPRNWRRAHAAFVSIAVIGTVLHALLIEGTMETVTKVVLCGAVAFAAALAISRARLWPRARTRAE